MRPKLKPRRPRPKLIDGFSPSAWKSLAIKSLRMGWPGGMRAAAERLAPSAMEVLLICGVFEDIFPAGAELAAVRAEIEARDYERLCLRQTHHGRGYTDAFCDLEPEAMDAAHSERAGLWAEAQRLELWLPGRAMNCFWTWLKLAPSDVRAQRAWDLTAWTGMPTAMLDSHTYEGKVGRTPVTVLSGHYFNHRRLARRVEADGWAPIRRQVHAERAAPDNTAAEPRPF